MGIKINGKSIPIISNGNLNIPKNVVSKPVITINYEGNTVISGTPSPSNPATLTSFIPDQRIGELWSLPDGTRDTYNGETGELVRRISKIIFNGTETITEFYSALSDVYRVRIKINNVFISDVDKYGIFTHFPYVPSYNLNNPHGYIYNSEAIIYIPKSLLAGNTADAAKAWLADQYAAGTPVTVLYELANPIVEYLIQTIPMSTRATDVIAPSWTGKTTVFGEPSPDNPATITGVPFVATATGPDGQTRSVDLGFTGYSLPDGTADSYDGKDGDFVRRIQKIELENITSASHRVVDSVDIFITGIGTHESAVRTSNGYCTHMKFAYGYGGDETHVYTNGVDLVLCFATSMGISTLELLNTWLTAQAAAGTPVTVLYELAQPIAYNRKTDITAFEGKTTVTGADSVEVIEGRVLRVADCLPFEIVRVNKNLLDNPYPWQINQRGQIEYSGNGTYATDRYCFYNGSVGTLTVTENEFVEFTPSAAWGGICQFSDRYLRPGDVYTFSAILKNRQSVRFAGHLSVVGFSQAGNFEIKTYNPFSLEPGEEDIIQSTFEIPKISEKISFGIMEGYPHIAGSKIAIKQLKLEQGTVSTIGRKVGGIIIPTSPPPDYGLELLKCQRYYLGPVTGREAASLYNKSAYITLHTPVLMRISPRINFPSAVSIITDGNAAKNINVESVYQSSAGLTGIYTTINFENFSVTGSKVGILEMYNVTLSAEL